MTVRPTLYGPVADREALNEAAMAIRPLPIRECQDLANKLSYLAGVRVTALSPALVANAIALCTTVMGELAVQADPSRYLMGDETGFGVDAEMISDLVQSRQRARAIVSTARDQLKVMVGGLLVA